MPILTSPIVASTITYFFRLVIQIWNPLLVQTPKSLQTLQHKSLQTLLR
nr:MAG TPA: hypothetical protein [Caudoviricetes sp.]